MDKHKPADLTLLILLLLLFKVYSFSYFSINNHYKMLQSQKTSLINSVYEKSLKFEYNKKFHLVFIGVFFNLLSSENLNFKVDNIDNPLEAFSSLSMCNPVIFMTVTFCQWIYVSFTRASYHPPPPGILLTPQSHTPTTS